MEGTRAEGRSVGVAGGERPRPPRPHSRPRLAPPVSAALEGLPRGGGHVGGRSFFIAQAPARRYEKASTPERSEKIGDRRAMGAQRLDARALRGEQAALGVDHIELARDAVLVAQAW